MGQLKMKILYITMILSAMGLSSCSLPKESISISIWHVYGGQSNSPLNEAIEVFNNTVGKEEGINVEVTSVSNTNNIHDAVIASSFQKPGASKLPDMFISYPKTVLTMKDKDVLVDYNDYFTEDELSLYINEFVDEGIVEDNLNIMPIAKSTEIMFINKTVFDRFAAENDVKIENLDTWEGLFETAIKYYKWTDDKTPEVEGDGKNFFVHDYHFNYFQVGVASMGADFFASEDIAFDENFKRAWEPYAKAAIQGGIWLQEGYATEPLRTGDAVVSVASSASVLYYTNIVTYPDNTSETVELLARPAPIFDGGERKVMQRGAGICTVKSDKKREEACMTFIRWITEPKNNVDFVVNAGYMPVTYEAFDTYLEPAISGISEDKYKSLYEAFVKTNEDYSYYTAPKFEAYLDIEVNFEEKTRSILTEARSRYAEAGEDVDKEALLAELVESSYEELKKLMER